MNFKPPFSNRHEAGRLLAEKLRGRKLHDPIVLAVPKGGIAVGFELAEALNAPLEPLLVRKLCSPLIPDRYFGALSEGGNAVMNREAAEALGLSAEAINERLRHTAHVLQRRISLYRPDHRLPSLSGRSVILVDDYSDSGWSVLAALARIRPERPRELILALPVLPRLAREGLQGRVEGMAFLHSPLTWDGPEAWYASEGGSDEDALELLSHCSRKGTEAKP